MINSLNNFNKININQRELSFNSKKVPRFLYHFTTLKNWKAIQKSGHIRTGYDKCLKDRVFMMDLKNFFGPWKDGVSSQNPLILSFLKYIQKDTSDLVVLRIPTENLDKNKLVLRSLNIFLNHQRDPEFAFQYFVKRNYPKDKKSIHCIEGDLYTNSRKYRKHAYEFAYSDKISVDNVELITIKDKSFLEKLQNLFKKTPDKKEKSILETLHDLFAGTPEYKGLCRLSDKQHLF